MTLVVGNNLHSSSPLNTIHVCELNFSHDTSRSARSPATHPTQEYVVPRSE